MTEPAPLDEKILKAARTCPRCDAPATPSSTSVQTCSGCKKPFVLVAGARLDSAVVPKDPRGAKEIRLKYSETLLRHSASVTGDAVAHAFLDPVTGHIPVDTRAIAFRDIVTIGLYRRPAYGTLIALVLLFFVPVVLPLLWVSTSEPLTFTFSIPALVLFVLGMRQYAVVGVQRMRVVSPGLTLVFRFDTPMWKRKKFLAAVIERTGVANLGELRWA